MRKEIKKQGFLPVVEMIMHEEKTKPSSDSLADFFVDQAELIDEIVESIMRQREIQIFRAE